MSKNKKILFATLFGLDVALTLFLFIISIIMIATMPTTPEEVTINLNKSGMIPYFQNNPTVFLFVIVIPLFLLLVANIIATVVYVKKTSKGKQITIEDLTPEQKEALQKDLLKDLEKK
ncbi:MAG: hypothetical protein ACI31G_00070 [Bacilli bacterium]